ncbi:gas vesicle protein GvpG [Bacillus sp. CHD6a]|uniref:gas vesicle protein GvpG n=1 Tax=Bacillus sp. CHD6a TaxID=1643452 RepID=UPI0006CD387D|nr:gas vesicle protein GvpG [Bacillus sp. CHD6a]KPB04749.1 gas vesicle protein GvpG [Bacillus sp. CHD6a]
MIHKLLTGPIGALVKLGEKIKEEVDREMYDIDHIQKQLVQLEMLMETDEITEEQYHAQEEELLQRYEVAKLREQRMFEELKRRNGGA